MDKVFIKKMNFYGYHGVLSEENEIGQRFFVDLELEMDLKKAGKTDDLDETADYGKIYDLIKEVVEGQTFKLVEALAETITEKLFDTFERIEGCWVKITKPDPPIPGYYEAVGVEIHRSRNS